MNKLATLVVIVSAAAFSMAFADAEPPAAEAARKATEVGNIFRSLIAATESDNYEAFIAQCDATMEATLTKEMLDSVSHQIAPRLQKGYDSDLAPIKWTRGCAIDRKHN